jgi:CARDB
VSVSGDDPLDFEFVEDATRETSPSHGGGSGEGGGRGPRPPRSRSDQAITPLLRLVALIAFAILVVVLLVLWVDGCRSDAARDTYNTYYEQVGVVGAGSAKIGRNLAAVLTTPNLKQAELEQKLGGLIQQQQLGVKQATDIDPPGPLTPANDHAIEALELRVGGLQGLLDTFKATASTSDATAAGEQLAARANRLEASDVVWSDLFQAQADATAAAEGVDGAAAAPASVFVSNPALYTPESLTAIWQRVHGASTGGTPTGLHGSGLEFTKVLPSGDELSQSTETTIQVSTDLGFEVGVTNSGESQEVQVEVTLTIPKQPAPIAKTATIDLLDPGETTSVVFKNFPEVPFGEKTTVQVSVKPVPGESNTSNNSAEYPVIFSLG